MYMYTSPKHHIYNFCENYRLFHYLFILKFYCYKRWDRYFFKRLAILILILPKYGTKLSVFLHFIVSIDFIVASR